MDRRHIGWALIIMLALSPALAWYLLRPKGPLLTYVDATHALGQLSALTGLSLFAITFILSTRWTFLEGLFGGLDKVYRVHATTGALTLVLLLFHPILLVLKFIPSDMPLAAEYLLWSEYWSVNLGIIALLSMIILVGVTLYMKLRYQGWKISHELLGAVFILGLLHSFLVRNDVARDYIFAGYPIYVGIVAGIGLGAFLYSLAVRRFLRHKYTVEQIRTQNKTIHSMVLSPVKRPMRYKSGQFVFLRFKRLGWESHPFSLASPTNDHRIKVHIKALGDFTEKLSTVKAGDVVSVEGPYGRFNFDRHRRDQVWVAGGIGITPFIGMAEDFKKNEQKAKVDLYYSVKQADEFVALDVFRHAEAVTKRQFRLFPWITADKGYLTVNDIYNGSGKLAGKEFFLCGPEAFKKSLTQALIEQGVPAGMINSEDFSFK